jgi:hypothetical protein
MTVRKRCAAAIVRQDRRSRRTGALRQSHALACAPSTAIANVRQAESNMGDDKRNTGSPDRDRINANEDYGLQYWSKELGVTPQELRAAVQAAGPTAEAVRRHLGR